MTTKYFKGRLYSLKIADLLPDPNQARKFIDPIALNELTASIQKLGVMTPIQFRQNEESAPVIVSGHRRVMAAGKAGLTEIKGTYTDGDTRLKGFVDNLQREDLLPIDEAEEMAALMTEYSFNQQQLADSLGKAKSSVSETLMLNNLPEDVRSACQTNPVFTKTFLLKIAKMKTQDAMSRKFQKYMDSAAKASQPATKPKRLSQERTLIMKTDELAGKFDTLPWREWSEDDRNDLVNALQNVRNRADVLLADIEAPPPEAEEAQEGERPPSKNLA